MTVAVLGLGLVLAIAIPNHGGEGADAPTAPFIRPKLPPLSPAARQQRERAITRAQPVAVSYASQLDHKRHASSTQSDLKVAFADARTVGFVLQYTSNDGSDDRLYAVRLRNRHGRWNVDYERQGLRRGVVYAVNFTPRGFVPRSTDARFHSWWPLLVVLLVLIALVIAWERRFRRRGRIAMG